MANPNDLKKIILGMRNDQISKKFIEDNFGKYRDEKTGKMIPPKYNLMITRDISKEDMYVVFGKEGTEEAYNNACIIHYAGKLKPWQSPLLEFSFQWWNVAIMLPSFHDIWDNMVEKLAENEIINKTSVEYRIGSLFTFIPQKFSLLFSFIKDYGFKGLAYKIKEKFK